MENNDYMCVVVRPGSQNDNSDNNDDRYKKLPYQRDAETPYQAHDDYAYSSTLIRTTDQPQEQKNAFDKEGENYIYNYAVNSTVIRAEDPKGKDLVQGTSDGETQSLRSGTSNGSLRLIHSPEGSQSSYDPDVSINSFYPQHPSLASSASLPLSTVPTLLPRSFTPRTLPPTFSTPPPQQKKYHMQVTSNWKNGPAQSLSIISVEYMRPLPPTLSPPLPTVPPPPPRSNTPSSLPPNSLTTSPPLPLYPTTIIQRRISNDRNKMLEQSKESIIEKLVDKKWTKRYIRLQPTYRCLIYYLSQEHRKKDRVRGIYHLLKAEINEGKCSDGHTYCFNIRLLTGQMLDFRVDTQVLREDWCNRFYTVASKESEPVVSKVTGELLEPGTFSCKRSHAVLDPKYKTLALYSSSEDTQKLKQEYMVSGSTVIPHKSYNEVYDFTLQTRAGKKVRFRTLTIREWSRWCEALDFVSKN